MRWMVVGAIVAGAVGCSSSSTPDSGPVDSGPVDSGTPDAGPVDAGPVDAGPADSGPADAGQVCTVPTLNNTNAITTYSCAGIGGCLQSQGFSVAAIMGCEDLASPDGGFADGGTPLAANLFTNVVTCGIGCASESNPGACVNMVIGDGGMCESQWNVCAAQGPGCANALECINNLTITPDGGEAELTNCTLTANSHGLGLAQDLLGCVLGICGPPDAGTTGDGGPATTVDAGPGLTQSCVSAAMAGPCSCEAAACAADTASGGADGGT